MYEVLLQRSTGSKEHFKKIVLLLLCSYAPLEEDKMYQPQYNESEEYLL